MPNITLTIDAQDGRAEAKLQQVEAGVRKLEAAVKIGDRTLRGNVTTEEQMVKTLDRFTEAEKRAAKAVENRHKAMGSSFAQTAARALNDADEANFKRSQRRMADMLQAQEKQGGAFKRGLLSAASFGASLIGVGSAAAAASAAMAILISKQEHQMELARRSDESAKGIKEFVALQAPGAAGQAHVKDTILKGADAGVNATEAAKMAQPIQSVVDANGDGSLDPEEKKKFDEDYAAALKLRQMGVSAEDAGTVITANRTKGIGGTVAADKLTMAADKSVGGPADFARAASAINQFSDSDTGLAAATALTAEGTPLEQLPTLVRGAALTLGSANDDSEFSKKFGLVGLSEADKLAKLREEGDKRGTGATREARIDNFSRSFQSKEGGGLDEEKARAMGLLVRQGDLFGGTLDALKGTETTGRADAKVGQLKADALTGSMMLSERAATLSESNAIYGPEAQDARDKRAGVLSRGAQLQASSASFATDNNGEALPWYNPNRIMAEVAAFTMPGSAPQGPQGGGDSSAQLKTSLDELSKSLKENTAATVANSDASAGGGAKKATGGAVSNAEEKY